MQHERLASRNTDVMNVLEAGGPPKDEVLRLREKLLSLFGLLLEVT